MNIALARAPNMT